MLRDIRVVRNSMKQTVSFQVIGDAGHDPDAEGVLFFEEEMRFPPVATPAEIAAAVVARYGELYAEGYANWRHYLEVVALIRSLL